MNGDADSHGERALDLLRAMLLNHYYGVSLNESVSDVQKVLLDAGLWFSPTDAISDFAPTGQIHGPTSDYFPP